MTQLETISRCDTAVVVVRGGGRAAAGVQAGYGVVCGSSGGARGG